MSHLSNSFGAFLLLTVMGGGLAPEVLASSVRPTMTITQQQDALQGVVTDANGEPVMGAAVRVKNSGRVSVTKDDGSFSIPGVKKGVMSEKVCKILLVLALMLGVPQAWGKFVMLIYLCHFT